jgi:hypothetical protein
MLATTDQVPTLLTVQQFCEKHKAFTLGGMRWLLFNRTTNGLEQAVVVVGRRLLLNETEFFRWLSAQNAPQKQQARNDPKNSGSHKRPSRNPRGYTQNRKR